MSQLILGSQFMSLFSYGIFEVFFIETAEVTLMYLSVREVNNITAIELPKFLAILHNVY